MIKNKKYKIGFDIWGLIIFIVIMIPNFIWFAVPAPNDILRGESITKTVDVIASICQVLMVMSLCIFINQERKKISITRYYNYNYLLCTVFFMLGILLCRCDECHCYIGFDYFSVLGISVFRY